MKELDFYICKHCGNIVVKVKDSGVDIVCCGEEMVKLVPGEVDAAVEKHVPVVTKEDNKLTVNVGDIDHPMIEEHYIMWIAIQFEDGFEIKYLKPGDSPSAVFYNDKRPIQIFEYCNLHGLWKTNM